MSTRLLQTMIEAHRQGTSVSTEAICEAERELEAIREAAREVVSYKALEDWQSSMPSELAASIRLIQRIAKEE